MNQPGVDNYSALSLNSSQGSFGHNSAASVWGGPRLTSRGYSGSLLLRDYLRDAMVHPQQSDAVNNLEMPRGVNAPWVSFENVLPFLLLFQSNPREQSLSGSLQDKVAKVLPEADIESLKKQYVFRNPDVVEFLNAHPSASSLLLRASSELKVSFGDEPVLALEATVDEDGSRYLYAIVIWRDQVEDAEKALQEFDERWWLHQTHPAGLTFTYELA